ncbi:hypothetical protein [Spiroplasma endosymbiont of Aspidapion aeneum]|uniref:hypothetical protein n=1 Tax=Spiroplasma endosymbiont of Aspidapion aeneum TaxID=3066276 RepID=UPI00313ADF63
MEVLSYLENYFNKEKLCIFVSHSPKELREVCNKVLIFKHGTISKILYQPKIYSENDFEEMIKGYLEND